MANILAVDDSPDVLKHLNVLLKSFGHDFSYIAKPEFLFNRLDEDDYDLIFMDVNMPGINGIDLLKELKAHKHYKEIPVIMVTGEDDLNSFKKCFELGVADFIKKPINEVILQARTNAVLSARKHLLQTLKDQDKIRKQELKLEKQKTIQYQLRSLTASMDPHFIFNSLNAVQYYILDNKMDEAMEFIANFSSLMRISLNNSNRQYISLNEEMEFLESYLKIEQKRFSDKLKFQITIDDKIKDGDYRIPPMLVQPYVENSIVHGILNRNGNGNISIHFKQDANLISCEVVDDGIGRPAAMKINQRKRESTYKSQGMSITKFRLQLLNDLEKNAFSVRIFNLKKGNHPTGTKVTITFPKDL